MIKCEDNIIVINGQKKGVCFGGSIRQGLNLRKNLKHN